MKSHKLVYERIAKAAKLEIVAAGLLVGARIMNIADYRNVDGL